MRRQGPPWRPRRRPTTGRGAGTRRGKFSGWGQFATGQFLARQERGERLSEKSESAFRTHGLLAPPKPKRGLSQHAAPADLQRRRADPNAGDPRPALTREETSPGTKKQARNAFTLEPWQPETSIAERQRCLLAGAGRLRLGFSLTPGGTFQASCAWRRRASLLELQVGNASRPSPGNPRRQRGIRQLEQLEPPAPCGTERRKREMEPASAPG